MPYYSPLTNAHLTTLRTLLGHDQVRTDEVTLGRCSRDETEDLVFPPEAVVLPRDRDQVATLLRFAHEERIPVTPRGAGTGLSGGALPVAGGIVLSMERLEAIREISTRDQLAVVEAGVTTARLREAAAEHGLYYPRIQGARRAVSSVATSPRTRPAPDL